MGFPEYNLLAVGVTVVEMVVYMASKHSNKTFLYNVEGFKLAFLIMRWREVSAVLMTGVLSFTQVIHSLLLFGV